MKTKTFLTKADKDFIRANYLTMHDSEISGALGMRAYYIHEFRIKEGLMKKPPNETKVCKMKGKWFKVNEVENWIA